MAIASEVPDTPLSVIYGRADGVPQGVRLRIALDVLEALAEQRFSLARRSGDGLSISSVTVGADGMGCVAVGSATNGAPELVWEVLAGCPAEGDLRALREIVDEIPIDVSELIEKVLSDDPELGSAGELLEALARASEGHVATRADVIELAHAPSATADVAPAASRAELAKPAPIESPKEAPPAPTMISRVEASKLPPVEMVGDSPIESPPASPTEETRKPPPIEAPKAAAPVAVQTPETVNPSGPEKSKSALRPVQASEPKPATPKPLVPKPPAPKPVAPKLAPAKPIEQTISAEPRLADSKAEAAVFEDDWDIEANADAPWPAKTGNETKNVAQAASTVPPEEARHVEVPSIKQTLAFGMPRPAVPARSPGPPKATERRVPTIRYPQKSSPELAAPAAPPVGSEKASSVEPVATNAETGPAPAQSNEHPATGGDSTRSPETEALTSTATEPVQPVETPFPEGAPATVESAADVAPSASEPQEPAQPAPPAIEFGPRPTAPVSAAVSAPIPARSPAAPRVGENFTIKGTQIIRAPAAPATPPNTSAAAFERTLRPEETAASIAKAAPPPPSVGRTKLESFDESTATRRRPTRVLGRRQLGLGVILASVVALVVLAVVAILASH